MAKNVTTSATFTVEEAGRLLGIGRDLAYEHARAGSIGGIPVLRVGRRLLVPRPALERVLRGEVTVHTTDGDGV